MHQDFSFQQSKAVSSVHYSLNEFDLCYAALVYMPPPEPHLHGGSTALCRALNRTLPDVDRTYPNPVY